MKCLVTGGAGFIGSHVVDLLIKEGHEVTILDDLTTGVMENVNPKAEFRKGSVDNVGITHKITQGIDWVFHLAAWARVPRSMEDPVGTHLVNVDGTLKLLQACRLNKVKRFIYSSSSSVYGDNKDHVMHEQMAKSPKSPYALQKWIGEQYCDLFSRLFKMEIVKLRYFNVYGPRQLVDGAYSLVIGKFIRQKRDGEDMTIFGDGLQTRAYTHVSDVARANLLAANFEFPDPKVTVVNNCYAFNIGCREETTVKRLAELIGGSVKYITPNPRGDFEERRKCADNRWAKTVLKWEPTLNIEEGIKTVL